MVVIIIGDKMNWKIMGAIVISILVISGVIIYILAILSTPTQTPPPYYFYWRPDVLKENKTTVVLEIRDIRIMALNTETQEKWVNITNKTKIPLYSVVDFSGEYPVQYPFNSSRLIYEDLDNDSAFSIGDRIVINKSAIPMENYSNFGGFSVITLYPWEKLSYKYGVIGADVAVAKVPPPYVKVTPQVLHKVYDYEDHCIQTGGNIPYYVWGIINEHRIR